MPTGVGVEALQEARANAALPAAGAWDATPPELVCAEADEVLLSFTYTRGAVGGAFDFQVQVSPYSVAALVPAGAQEWQPMSLYAAGGVVAGADSQSHVQREYMTYGATGAAAEAFVYGPIRLDGAVERLRVRAMESGVGGSPGTLQITAVFQEAIDVHY